MADQFAAVHLNIEDALYPITFDHPIGNFSPSSSRLVQEIEENLRITSEAAAAEVLNAITASTNQAIVEQVLSQREALASLASSLGAYQPTLLEMQDTIARSIAIVEAAARSYEAPANHWANALAVVSSFEEFSLHQAQRLEVDVEVVAARRARVTKLSGSLLTSALASTGAMLEAPGIRDEKLVQPVKPRLFGPLNQHLGFVYRAELN